MRLKIAKGVAHGLAWMQPKKVGTSSLLLPSRLFLDSLHLQFRSHASHHHQRHWGSSSWKQAYAEMRCVFFCCRAYGASYGEVSGFVAAKLILDVNGGFWGARFGWSNVIGFMELLMKKSRDSSRLSSSLSSMVVSEEPKLVDPVLLQHRQNIQ